MFVDHAHRWARRPLAIALLAIALLAASCTNDADDSASGEAAQNETSTSTPLTTPPSAAPTTAPPTTPPPAPPAEDRNREETAGPPIIDGVGSEGIGDSLFPSMGNGGYNVTDYDLVIDATTDEIVALATIELVALGDLRQFTLDLSGLTIDGLTVDGVDAEVSRIGTEVIVTPIEPIAESTSAVVVVAYRGVPEPLSDAAALGASGWITEPWGSYVASEPAGAMTWFPSNNHPLDKATFTITVTVPADEIAAGPGVLTSDTTDGDLRTFVWEMSDPMTTYLASVVTGDFVIADVGRIEGVEMRHVVPTDRADLILGNLEGVYEEMLPLFSERFGPYPFDSYGVVAVPETLGYALENQTLSLFEADFLASDLFFSELVQAHELAHQWFGNTVSPTDWSDIWLNEGFATWVDTDWVGRINGRNLFDDVAASAPNFEPLTGIEPDELFSATVYQRGGLTLEALRRTVGDDAFFGFLRTWIERHRDQTASTDDFLALVNEQFGADAEVLMRSWIFDETMPELPAL